MRLALGIALCWVSATLASSALAESPQPEESPALVLSCAPDLATFQDLRDPVTRIRLNVSGSTATIVHEMRSGATYNRTEQYRKQAARWRGNNFAWLGVQAKNPRISMVALIESNSDGYEYREAQFDADLDGSRIYELSSSCTIGTPNLPDLNEDRSSLASSEPMASKWISTPDYVADKERILRVVSERLFSCVETMQTKTTASKKGAAVVDAPDALACEERVSELVSARMLAGDLENRDSLRAAIRADVARRALQIQAEAQTAKKSRN